MCDKEKPIAVIHKLNRKILSAKLVSPSYFLKFVLHLKQDAVYMEI